MLPTLLFALWLLLSHFYLRYLLTCFPRLLHVIYISLQAFAGQNQTLVETVMN